jgi:glycosyltransferase involved in cell wall biosynthesis
LAAAAQNLRLRPADLRLLVLGDVQPQDQAQIEALGLGPFLQVSPMMPYEEGLSLLRGADVLFLCDYDVEPYFVPGKLFDYLRVGRPILALSANEEVHQLIHQTRSGRALHPDDAAGQIALWERIVQEGATAALDFAPAERERLSADYAAEQLARALSDA